MKTPEIATAFCLIFSKNPLEVIFKGKLIDNHISRKNLVILQKVYNNFL
jgi:hypothetical protein